MRRNPFLQPILLFLVLLSGCQLAWSIEIESSLKSKKFGKSEFDALLERFPENEYCEGLLFEQVLYENGFKVIDSIKIISEAGDDYEYLWEIASESICLQKNGVLSIGKGTMKPTEISIIEAQMEPALFHITNIPPTVISALGLPTDMMPGKSLVQDEYKHVVIIFLDGFGFEKFRYAQKKGLIEFLDKADHSLKAISVYPPRTVTATAAVLTGLLPKENGVDRGGIRKTESTTIFDIAKENEISSAAIEGESMTFNLRNTEVVLSGDRDLNGGTDDNVFKNAMDVISESMPELLWIHFHGIDDYGHTFGPDAPILDEKISEINGYLVEIFTALPEDTLIIYFADHGMHTVHEEGRLGNHGHLIYEDMMVPVIIKTK